jgi:GGDEF domain-containing protein
VAGRMVRLSVSIGVATFPADGQDPRGIIAAADLAMYRDKHARALATGSEAPQAEVV